MASKFHRRGLKDARVSAGLSQRDLARRIGITKNFVVEVENGHRDAGYQTMVNWTRALGPYGSFDLFRQLERKPTKADSSEVA